ncbi:hypothetical protein NUW58_g1205 [Xylaria curta]|uniref:Uncharacterized protein n=1 Tax=Xylaria curta TaxID=42375 RepID=A0ACC1PNV5_9PEZI|nr:hypothetical protein NUW58_g1205 [Xylaria curta]
MARKGNKNSKENTPKSPQKGPQTPTPRTPNPTSPVELPIRTPEQPAYTLPPLKSNRAVAFPMVSPFVSPEPLLRPSVQRTLPRDSLELIEMSLNIYREKKRDFSNLSAISAQSSPHKLTKVEQKTGDVEDYLPGIRQKIKMADTAFETKQSILKEVKKTWENGSNKMTRGQFQAETKLLEEEIGDLLVVKAGMRTSTYELAGREVDTERWDKRTHNDDWAYLDLLLSRMQELSGSTVTMKATRDENKQSRWRQAVFKAYGRDNDEVWCPITRLWFPASCITAAHIVRYNVTELAAEHLFGPAKDPNGHIWSTKNGIPLQCGYEKMLDDAKIAIIPTTDGKDLKVVVLDHNLIEGEEAKEQSAMQQLHGRILEFKTDHRPAMLYLYFNFAMNLLRRQRYAVDGWWKGQVRYTEVPFFATPGKWVREATLRSLAVRVGHLPIDEAREFVDVTQGNKPEGSHEVEEEGPNRNDEEDEDDGEKEEVIVSLLQHTYRP